MILNPKILSQTVETIRPYSHQFILSVYDNLLKIDPQAKLPIPPDAPDIGDRFIKALSFIVEYGRHQEILGQFLNKFGSRFFHLYGKSQASYSIIVQAILSTFAEYLQDDWTPVVKQAWEDAFASLIREMFGSIHNEHLGPKKSQVIPTKLLKR